MRRSMLQIVWAAIADLPTSTRWSSRSHTPDRLFSVFDDIIQRTTMHFVSNFLLALPKEFIQGDALNKAVNSNSRLEALQSREDLLELLKSWKPIRVFPIITFRPNRGQATRQWAENPGQYEPINYWIKTLRQTIAEEGVRLSGTWPSFHNSLKLAFSKVERAIWSTELVDTCVRKLARILVILVKRPQELIYSEPWVANHSLLVEHLRIVCKDFKSVDFKLW